MSLIVTLLLGSPYTFSQKASSLFIYLPKKPPPVFALRQIKRTTTEDLGKIISSIEDKNHNSTPIDHYAMYIRMTCPRCTYQLNRWGPEPPCHRPALFIFAPVLRLIDPHHYPRFSPARTTRRNIH